ncbi:MAG TPA: phage major capsid protein, partial [Planctomycetota bacterium]|nr:phage major capsid protein [Planctomycetota bacterium]
MDPKELRALRSQKIDEAEAIRKKAEAEKRTLSDEERKSFQSLLEESKKLLNEAELYEELARAQVAISAPMDQRLAIIDPAEHRAPTDQERQMAINQPWRYQLRAFTPERLGVPMEQCRQMALEAGMWLGSKVYRIDACTRWCTEHRVMVEGINTKGGVTVPEVLERVILDMRLEFGSARRFCRVWPMSSDTDRIPRVVGNTTAYFAGENPADDYTASDMALDMVELNPKKLVVETKISKELNEDAIVPIADLVARDAAWAMAQKEDQCWIDGTGISTYGGMVGIRTKMVDGSHAASYFGATAHDQWGEYTDGDLINTAAKIPQYADARAAWYVHKVCWYATMLRLMAAVGGNTIATLMAGAGNQRAYLGTPVNLVNAMPSASTAYNGTIVALVGDMAMAASFGDRRGMTLQVLYEKYAEKGLLALLFDERFEIVVHDIGD